jgi:hypothetical protein
MSQTGTSQNAVCPRCRSAKIEVLSTSPVTGVWTVYGCGICLYAWRSTEPDENTNPDRYPVPFRLTPEDLAKFAIVPTIPPLRSRSPG